MKTKVDKSLTIHSEMKLLSGPSFYSNLIAGDFIGVANSDKGILALAQADPSTFFTTCGPVLSYSSSSIHTELAGDWKVAVDGSQQALTNDNYPYYQVCFNSFVDYRIL